MEDPDYLRFYQHYPSGGDLTLQILKGHLLVEEQLRHIFELLLAHPDALKGERGTSFECHEVICLVEALSPIGRDEPWIWSAAKRLNSLRNQLAHDLEPRALDEKVKTLVKFVIEDNPSINAIMASAPGYPGGEFEGVIFTLHAGLSKLKELTAARKERQQTAPEA